MSDSSLSFLSLDTVTSFAVILTLVMLVFVVVTFVQAITKIGRNRYSHKIAVLGLPRSGKTTIISTAFSRMLRLEVSKNISVSGLETIERITKYFELILTGQNIGPSSDADVFSYRFTYLKPRKFFVLLQRFDVEIADFPGEYSQEYFGSTRRYGEAELADADNLSEFLENSLSMKLEPNSKKDNIGIYGNEFQSWVSQADEYLIVVDIADVLMKPARANLIQAQIFDAVLKLKESSLEGASELSNKSVALVISKCDAIFEKENFNEEYLELASYVSVNEERKNRSEDVKNSNGFFEEKKKKALSQLAPSLEILESNFMNVEIIFHSSYLRNKYFEKSELKLIEFVLP